MVVATAKLDGKNSRSRRLAESLFVVHRPELPLLLFEVRKNLAMRLNDYPCISVIIPEMVPGVVPPTFVVMQRQELS